MESFFGTLSALRKEGKHDEALTRLQTALRHGVLGPEDLERAGRFLAKDYEARKTDGAIRVRLLGQCTTSWMAPVLTAIAWGRGVRLTVSEAEYDNVVQDLVAEHTPRPQVLVMVPWNQRVLAAHDRAPSARIHDELELWRQAWTLASANGASHIVQVGYDWVVPGALGHHIGGAAGGDVALVRELNHELRAALPRGAYFVDLEQVSGVVGRARFYDPRQYHWTKQPFSTEGLVALCTQIFAGIRALLVGPKKVLVLDLDNTLWGGVVGETGPHGVALGDSAEGEAYRAFQKHAKALAARGVLLAVASKNNPEDARGPFETNPDSILSMNDFAAFEASWEPKAAALRRIAEALNLGLESFVFFDDNPAEREHIRQALPEVEVVEVPDDPAEYVRALQAGLWFETVRLTEEDQARTEQYVVERQRLAIKQSSGSIEEYLTSLEMIAVVEPIERSNMQRSVQLIGKTNQFNLTTRRHSEQQVAAMLATPGSVGLTLRMKDRFGDYGLVAVVIAVPEANAQVPTLVIDTLLMSCRVIGRTVEQFLIADIVARAERLGYQQVVGEYIPTKKNALVAGLYSELGFQEAGPSPSGGTRYRLELPLRAPLARTFVTLAPG